MDWKLFATVFATTFLAEIGDKTQLTIVSYACGNRNWLSVFIGGALALVLTTLIGALAGTGLQKLIPVRVIHMVAAAAFIIVGILLLVNTLRSGSATNA
jgi:Ca2+/H+ antiporter, TMEM165/GDT1 family